MSEIKILTEVAGRVCAIPAAVGAAVSDGDDLVLVEAMKMEIPVPTTAAGKIKSILVKVDDIVEEGQAIAIVES
jgi:biotin carboxyl carrier protein